jgi:hypothetical protein
MFVCFSLASIGTCNSVNNMDTRNANILRKKMMKNKNKNKNETLKINKNKEPITHPTIPHTISSLRHAGSRTGQTKQSSKAKVMRSACSIPLLERVIFLYTTLLYHVILLHAQWVVQLPRSALRTTTWPEQIHPIKLYHLTPRPRVAKKKTISIPLLRELVFFVLGVLIVIIQQLLHVRRTGVFLSLRCFVQPLQGKDICLDKMNWRISTF